MKRPFLLFWTVLVTGLSAATGRATTLTDLDVTDGNSIVSQHSNGQLFADESIGEPGHPFDCIFTLSALDLERDQGWGSFWLDVANRSSSCWSSYTIEFYDRSFSQPLRLPFWFFSEGPAEYFPRWEFLPNFAANTVELSDGTGVAPGQGFYLSAGFNLTSLIPPGSTEFSFGIRQVPTAKTPEAGNTLALLGIACVLTGGLSRILRSGTT